MPNLLSSSQRADPHPHVTRRRLLKQAGLIAPLWLAGGRAWGADESTSAEMLVHGRTPHNSEPPLGKLIESWITPDRWFYVRSHAPVPKIDVEAFRLSVEGMVERPLSLSLKDLHDNFRNQSVVATLTCAGNRRSEHSLHKPVSGVPWQAGAIGNAQWTGARLSDLLNKAGVKPAANHVWFEGLDAIERPAGVIPFGASIPLEKALADTEAMPGALVVHAMNGKPLSPDHGYPLRTVAPGFIGARSVKWLGKIVVSDRPSPNHYVATAYKLVTEGSADEWAAAPPIETFVINSVICSPTAGAQVASGKVKVSGYALAPGIADRTIRQVELSTDGGRTWTAAQFTTPAKPYCWRLWNAEVAISARSKELIARATDSAGDMQPQRVDWNLKGYLFNAWHRTPLTATGGER